MPWFSSLWTANYCDSPRAWIQSHTWVFKQIFSVVSSFTAYLYGLFWLQDQLYTVYFHAYLQELGTVRGSKNDCHLPETNTNIKIQHWSLRELQFLPLLWVSFEVSHLMRNKGLMSCRKITCHLGESYFVRFIYSLLVQTLN